jgi:hypothetical protein
MYGKLKDGALIEAPQNLELEDGTVIENFNKSIQKMLEHGFKPIVDTKPGYDVDTQYCNFVRFIDSGRYIRYEWQVEDIEFSEAEIQNQEAQKAMEMLNMDFQAQVQTLPDEQALEVPSVFPVFQVGVNYEVGFKLRYKDILYKVLQAHTSQADWTPDVTPALWTVVSLDEWPEWVQPTGAQDAYAKGDKVSHNGKHWISEVDGNVWEPGIYGNLWSEVS